MSTPFAYLVEDQFWVFLVLTVIIGGGAAFLSGRALAFKWRPLWLTATYMVPLSAAVRFFHYALFEHTLFSLTHFVFAYVIVLGFCLLGYRLKRVSQMVNQYTWLYERTSPFTWREKSKA